MKKIKILAFLCLLLSGVYAQVPGYMGLKFSLQYQGSISPQWDNLKTSFVPYYSHNVQMGYVVSRRYEVGLQYTRIDYSSVFNRNPYDYNTGNNDVTIDHRGFTGNNVTAYVKFFAERKGYLAPLGRYILLGLNYENSRDVFHVTQDPYSTVSLPDNTTVQSSDIALTFGAGRNIILLDRMILSIEGDVNIPFTTAIRAGRNAPANEDAGVVNGVNLSSNTYKYQNALDVMLVNIFQIKIGIGLLAF